MNPSPSNRLSDGTYPSPPTLILDEDLEGWEICSICLGRGGDCTKCDGRGQLRAIIAPLPRLSHPITGVTLWLRLLIATPLVILATVFATLVISHPAAAAYPPMLVPQTVSPVALLDPLNDWSFSVSHTPNLYMDGRDQASFFSDQARVTRADFNAGVIIWQADKTQGFIISSYYWSGQTITPLQFAVSRDGRTWTAVTPQTRKDLGDHGWLRIVYASAYFAPMQYVRLTIPASSGVSWSPQIGGATILYGGTD